MRAAGAKRHDLLKAQLDSGKLDPRALISQSEQNRGQFDTQMKQARDQWLAVWDSLNDAQRSQVASMLKERQARMEQRHARMQERHGSGRSRPRRACASDGSSRQPSGASGAAAAWRDPRSTPGCPAPDAPAFGGRFSAFAQAESSAMAVGMSPLGPCRGMGRRLAAWSGQDPAWRAFPILMRGRGGVVPARHASGARGLAFSPSPARRHRIEPWHGLA